jgi:hypothetical protein
MPFVGRSAARLLRLSAVSSLVLLVAWDARGCRSTPETARVPCDTVAPQSGPITASLLAGEFDLELVTQQGRRVGGRLTLSTYSPGEMAPAARVARGEPGADAAYPLYGSADIDLRDAGAAAPGPIDRHDLEGPGVQAVEWQPAEPGSRRQLVLRLGADGNRGGPALFDGTYMTLTVQAATADGFSGSWASGAPDVTAQGFFCAVRRPAGG